MITKWKAAFSVGGKRRPFSCSLRTSGALVDHLIDQAVVLGFLGGQEVVALGVVLDLFQRLARALGQDLVQALAGLEDLACVDLDLGGLTLHAAQRLVDHDLGVGQRKALALGASGQQEGAHAGCDAGAQRGHIGLDEVHRVEDGQAGAHGAAGAVDVERNVLVGVFAFKEQQLGHDEVGRLVIDRAHQEDHPVLEQARVDVVRPLSAAGLFDDHWDHAQTLSFQCAHVFSSTRGLL